MRTSQRLRMLVAAALMLAAPVLIAACGGDDGGGGEVEVAQGGKPSGEVTISNWQGYIDPGKDGTAAEFEKTYGVEVIGKMLDEFAKGKNAVQAIQAACKVDRAAFEKAYREYLGKVVAQVRGGKAVKKRPSVADLQKAEIGRAHV